MDCTCRARRPWRFALFLSVLVCCLAAADSWGVQNTGGLGDARRVLSAANNLGLPFLASTYLGGSDDDQGLSAAVDSKGNVFVAGRTTSNDFPVTAGSFSTSFTYPDFFIAKLSSDLTQLLASTYFYKGWDEGILIAVDGQDNVFVAGSTDRPDFPVTPGAYEMQFDQHNVFVTKLNNDLDTLIASTFAYKVGSNGFSRTKGLVVDGAGNIFVSGQSSGGVFVVKLTNDLTQRPGLATIGDNYYGGGWMALDPQGNVFLLSEEAYPYTKRVTKFPNNLGATLATRTLDNSSPGTGAVAADPQGNVYVTGCELNYSPTGSTYDVFVMKFDSGLSGPTASTWFGGQGQGNGYDCPDAIAVDRFGNVYVTGYSYSDFLQSEGAGQGHLFLVKLSTFLTRRLFATRFGGSGDGRAMAMAVDKNGDVLLAGVTAAATDFPTTEGAYQTGLTGGLDGWVSKFRLYTPGQFKASDYFPLTPGLTWTYALGTGGTIHRKVLDKTVKVGGKETFVMEDAEWELQNYLTSDDTGIFLHRQLQRNVPMDLRKVTVVVTFNPPVKMAGGLSEVTENFYSAGTAEITAGGRKASASYSAEFSVETMEEISVPAGNFSTGRLFGRLNIPGGGTILQTYNLALHTGIVRETAIDEYGATDLLELASTNVGVHDLAVTEISAPKTVTLSTRTPVKTAVAKVTIQNRSPHTENIKDEATLKNLVTLTPLSLGACLPPTAALKTGKFTFPIVIKPKKSLKVDFDVTFSCANDPARSTAKSPHYDYRYGASVNHAALDGESDTHPGDDTCPRTVTPPYEVDPNPDGTIQDKGCGSKKTDGTFGGEIYTDVVR
jgi:hypothetical protein